MRILVVDDEQAVREALDRALRLDGYEVDLAADGVEALALVSKRPPDAVILDLMMPLIDGLEVCRRARRWRPHAGADPHRARRSVGSGDRPRRRCRRLRQSRSRSKSCWHACARSCAAPSRSDSQTLRFADLTLDRSSYEVKRGDREIELTRTEFHLMELFMLHPWQVLTRSVIFERVWEYDFGPTSNSLTVYMGYLRNKTEAGGESRLLHTVRGVGYVLRE